MLSQVPGAPPCEDSLSFDHCQADRGHNAQKMEFMCPSTCGKCYSAIIDTAVYRDIITESDARITLSGVSTALIGHNIVITQG